MTKDLSNEQMYNVGHVHVSTWEQDRDEITNHPKDPGGPTRNGVSLVYLQSLGIDVGDLNNDGKVDIDDIRLVSEDVAKNLFRKTFWVDAKASYLPPLTSIVYYDFSVTSGPGRAAIVLQQAMDGLIPKTILSYAANIGPKTQKAAEMFAERGLDYCLAIDYLSKRDQFYTGLGTSNPNQYSDFVKGWLNRDKACKAMINEIQTKGITDQLYRNIRRKYGF